jgi:hypothetical protein
MPAILKVTTVDSESDRIEDWRRLLGGCVLEEEHAFSSLLQVLHHLGFIDIF